jgi:tetratricopeptide (TPR) repeat protein
LLTAAALFLRGVVAAAQAGAGDIDQLVQQLSATPDDAMLGNRLRTQCRLRHMQDSCIAAFEELVAQHPASHALLYNAALAYVDKLPGLGIVSQARLSTHSMRHMTSIIEREPDDWTALYIRGLNELYWPSFFRKNDLAIDDLRRCVEIFEASPEKPSGEYHVLAYVALGDAYLKAGNVDKARSTWKQGLAVYASPQINRRLALDGEELRNYVESVRSRDQPIDTDFALLTNQADRTRL